MYLRQSIDKTGEELAIDRQRKDCLALCKARGWKVIGEYPDNDRSASNGKPRPQYQRMLADIRTGKVDVVVAQHQDRLHRNVMELLLFTEVAIEHNLKLATASGDIDLTTDDGEFMATLGAALARKEVRRKGARQRKANEQMAENDGRPWWPARPFGYDADRDPMTGRWWTVKKDPVTKKVIAVNTIRKHPVEAKLVREAYRQFNAGSPLYAIAERWNAKGIKTPLDNKWRASQVRSVLLAARNAGLREYDGKIVGEGTWPAIVTEEVWRHAVRRLADPRRKSGNAPPGRKYLLSGIVRCGRCGHPLTSLMTRLGRHNYVCQGGCRKLSRNGPKIDELIIEAVVRRLSREDAVDLLRPPTPEVDTEALREERRALKDRLVALGKDFATAPPEFTKAAVNQIQDRLDEIDAALEDPGKVQIYEGVIGAKDVRKAWGKLDLGRQRTIVDALLTITVNPVGKGNGAVFDPDAIDVDWK
jgi:site-specific DNA recombinase